MKKWMRHLIISVLLVIVFSAVTVSAKNTATAVLKKAEDSNDVTVSIDLSESKTELITSLRFQILVTVEEAREVEFDDKSVAFTFSDLTCDVRDAAVAYDSDFNDYVIDIIVSGKSHIFQDTDGPLEVGTLHLPSGDYYAEIGCVIADDTEDSASKLQYVESAGMQVSARHLTNDEVVCVGEKLHQSTPAETEPTGKETESEGTESTEAKPVETEPTGKETESEKTESPETKPTEEKPTGTKPAETEPVSSPQGTTESSWTPVTEGNTPSPAPEGETTKEKPKEKTKDKAKDKAKEKNKKKPAEKWPALRPAEKRKNGLSAPKLTLKPVTGTKKVTLTWNKIKNAKKYQIYKYDGKSGKYRKYRTVKGTSYTGKFSYGETCRFKVRAYKLKNGSKRFGAFSAETEVTVSSFNKQKRMSMQVKVPKSGEKFRFTWKQVEGADGYQIMLYFPRTKQYKPVKTVFNGEAQARRAVKFENAANYRFRMRAFAYDETGKKVYGAESPVVRITVPPAQVRKIEAESGQKSTVKVAWEEVSGADGYLIFRSDPGKKKMMKQVAKIKSNLLEYIDEDLESGARYYYQVAAYTLSEAGEKIIGEKSTKKSVEAE